MYVKRWDVVGMGVFGDEAHVCGEEGGHMCVWWRAILCRMVGHYACGDEGHMGTCANEGYVCGAEGHVKHINPLYFMHLIGPAEIHVLQ